MTTIAPGGRRHDLDALRVFSFGTLIIYHTSLIFGSGVFAGRAGGFSWVMDLVAMGSHPWRMSLLFFISGLVTASLATRKSAQEIRRSRTWQLLLPFLFGVVLIVPPQHYFVNLHAYPDLSYLQFLKIYVLAGITLEHMWFLVYLWIYVCIWSLIFSRFESHWHDVSSALASVMTGPGLFLVPVAFLSALRIFLYPVFGETLVITSDIYAHVMYFSIFMAGAFLCSETRFWQEIDRWRWVSLGLAGVSFLAIATTVTVLPREQWPELLVLAARIVRSILQWATMLALLAFAARFVRGPSRVVSYLNNSIMTYYILHQTIIVITAYYFSQSGGLDASSFLPIVIITVVTCFLAAEGKKLASTWGALVRSRLSALKKAAPQQSSPEAAG